MTQLRLSKQCLIALVGEAGAGKDTVGDKLWSLVKGLDLISIAFPMRKIAEGMFSLPPGPFVDRSLKDKPIDEEYFDKLTPRRVMQLLGTEAIKPIFGDDIWIKLLIRQAHRSFNGASVLVVTDVRFPQELQWIAQQPNSFAISIHRPNNPYKLKGKAADHASAKPLDIYEHMQADRCFNLVNNRGFEELEKAIISIIKKLTERGYIHKEQWLW